MERSRAGVGRGGRLLGYSPCKLGCLLATEDSGYAIVHPHEVHGKNAGQDYGRGPAPLGWREGAQCVVHCDVDVQDDAGSEENRSK